MNLTKHPVLRTKILERLKELEYTQSFIINDANERGQSIKSDRLSRYLNGKSGGITEDQLVWVATRLGIFINLNLGTLKMTNNKAEFVIEKYDELTVLQKLNKLFPNKTKNG